MVAAGFTSCEDSGTLDAGFSETLDETVSGAMSGAMNCATTAKRTTIAADRRTPSENPIAAVPLVSRISYTPSASFNSSRAIRWAG